MLSSSLRLVLSHGAVVIRKILIESYSSVALNWRPCYNRETHKYIRRFQDCYSVSLHSLKFLYSQCETMETAISTPESSFWFKVSSGSIIAGIHNLLPSSFKFSAILAFQMYTHLCVHAKSPKPL